MISDLHSSKCICSFTTTPEKTQQYQVAYSSSVFQWRIAIQGRETAVDENEKIV